MGNKNGSLDPEGRNSMAGQFENSYHSNSWSSKSKPNNEESVFVNGSNDNYDAS